jgi:hypothetical protein
MRPLIFALLLCLPLARPAAAEEGLALDESAEAATLDDDAPPLPLPGEPPRRRRIPDAALGLSLGATSLALVVGGELAGAGNNLGNKTLRSVGVGVALSGLALLPSSGHVYAGELKRAGLGVGLRAGALALAAGLLASGLTRESGDLLGAAAFGAAGLLGAAALGSGVADVLDSEAAVRRANER